MNTKNVVDCKICIDSHRSAIFVKCLVFHFRPPQVMASMNFYKTAEQVCSVLESLEREYKRDEDW